MVFVDVYVPSVDQSYHFSLNEQVQVQTVVAEITEMIALKEKTSFKGNIEGLHLYYRNTSMRIPDEYSLKDMRVTNGAQLILV